MTPGIDMTGTADAPDQGKPDQGKPLVGIVMGSRSDWETMQHAALRLEALGVAHEVRVVSAEPLDPEQLRHLLAKLTVRLGKQITATTAVDASLLGGFRVLHGDQVIDASLVSQLDSFKLNVLAAF